jgi:hypothetical protein
MNSDKENNLKKALKNNDSFIEYIKKQATTSDYYEKKKEAEQGPHPSSELLYDFVLNWADVKIESTIMDHIAYCSICSRQILEIMEIESEIDNEIFSLSDNLSVSERIRNIISNFSLPVFSFPEGAAATRSAIENVKPKYKVNESVVLNIPILSDGYLVVIHFDDSEKISLIYPSDKKDDGFVEKGSEKKISGVVTEPYGKQYFKIFWSAQKIFDQNLLDLQNPSSVEIAIDRFITEVDFLDENEWNETIHEFEVIE